MDPMTMTIIRWRPGVSDLDINSNRRLAIRRLLQKSIAEIIPNQRAAPLSLRIPNLPPNQEYPQYECHDVGVA